MKKLLVIFVIFVLSACTNVPTVVTPAVLPTKIIPTNTSVPPTPLPISTSTVEPSCDPFSADECISDGHFIFQRPIHPPGNDVVDPGYLYASTANGTREPHHGVEFPNASGTPVYAAASGVVLFAGPDTEAMYAPWPDFYGNLVVIQHEDDLFTLYAHLSKISVTAGEAVGPETKIGEVGKTGVAIGSHLHFEVRRGDAEDYFATQNPELWLVPAPDAAGDPLGTLSISVVGQDGNLVNYAKYTIRSTPQQPKEKMRSYYGLTYSADMLHSDENLVLGELPAGRYRIAIERNGKVYERWVEVESGKLTQVVIVVK